MVLRPPPEPPPELAFSENYSYRYILLILMFSTERAEAKWFYLKLFKKEQKFTCKDQLRRSFCAGKFLI
jgi:hypothetical protein